jgi:hypothetical protein
MAGTMGRRAAAGSTCHRTGGRIVPWLVRAAMPAALATSLAGCSTIDYVVSNWDVTSITIDGPAAVQAGQPAELTIVIELFGVDPGTPDDRRALLGDPDLYTWTVEPGDSAAVSPAGVFTASVPGTYAVTASAFGLEDDLEIAVTPSYAGTYAGTFSGTAIHPKTGRSAIYEAPLTLTIAADGGVTGTIHFEGRTKAGTVYLDASFQGAVASDGDITADGTAAIGPTKAKAKRGACTVTGSIAGATFYGMAALPSGGQGRVTADLQ